MYYTINGGAPSIILYTHFPIAKEVSEAEKKVNFKEELKEAMDMVQKASKVVYDPLQPNE